MRNFLLTVRISVIFTAILFLVSCAATRHYDVTKKYPANELRTDYDLLRNILQAKHPSLYWYTPKDSMDVYFESYRSQIRDSMTENQFAWFVLAPLIDKIRCGHTSVSMSKQYSKWARNKKFPGFPIYMKFWNDTMAVIGNLDRKDSVFKRGTIIKTINGVDADGFKKKMFDYLPEDGYANNVNYIRLSANFPYYHRNLYGLSRKYAVEYIDSTGNIKSDSVALYTFPKDSIRKDSILRAEKKKLPKSWKREQYRSLSIDSSGKFAVMTLNTFNEGRLRSFFRRSFRKLKEKNIETLVLDIRSNGGGRVSWSTLLTRYLTRSNFKNADSAFSVAKTLGPYRRYINGKIFNDIELFLIARKANDGHYHIRPMERKLRKPKRHNHFDGQVYVLINGPTFSAASLFANSVKGQKGITLVGEETGGGWYGNNGIMIPDIVLPNTHVRVRLPLFRIVQYNHIAEKGIGVQPDLYVPTSYEALLKGEDQKMELIKKMIYSSSPDSVRIKN